MWMRPGVIAAAAAVETESLLSSIDSNGWSGVYAEGTPPTFDPAGDPQTITLEREGFTATGSATTYTEDLILTHRVRQTWPNNASLTASTVSLSDYVYTTDTIAGCTNNSAESSPKPIANWTMLARGVIANSLPLELVAFHRNARQGREVAAVVFRATDGTNTVTATVNSTTISSNPYDQHAVIVYATTLDVSSLNNNALITVNAKVYPWIGGAASVLDSADQSGGREFSPRYYLKNTTIAATPPVAYVAEGGSSNGTVSTDPVTAAAAPFDTIDNAIDKAHTDLGATTGVDGLIIYCQDGTHAIASTAGARTQKVARITVTRSPTSTNRASVIITGGVSVTSLNLGTGGSLTSPLTTGCIQFTDVTIRRSGAQAFVSGGGTVKLDLQLVGVDFDRNTQTTAPLGTNGNTHGWYNGVTFTNGSNGMGAAQPENRMLRGINTATSSVEAWLVLGCTFSSIGNNGISPGTTRSGNGMIVFCNRMQQMSSTSTWSVGGNGQTVNGLVNSQNVYEWTTTSSGHSFSISNDSAAYSTVHVIQHHNTYAGWEARGRENIFYEDGSTPRTNKLHSFVGNIHVGVYHKGDVFRGENEGNPEGFTSQSPSTRVGNWSYLYGVGSRYEFAQFHSNGPLGTNQAQVYPGIGTTIGTTWNDTSQTTRLDPRFTDNRGTKSIFEATGSGSPTSASAGAGSGTYTLQSNSPAIGMVSEAILSHTLDGEARPLTNDNAGALSVAS